MKIIFYFWPKFFNPSKDGPIFRMFTSSPPPASERGHFYYPPPHHLLYASLSHSHSGSIPWRTMFKGNSADNTTRTRSGTTKLDFGQPKLNLNNYLSVLWIRIRDIMAVSETHRAQRQTSRIWINLRTFRLPTGL